VIVEAGEQPGLC